MSAKILDGKQVSELMLNAIAHKVEQRLHKNLKAPTLAVVIIGEDPASRIYVRNKKNACDKVGFNSIVYELPTETSQQELLELIRNLNEDNDINGIIVQLPLPSHLNANTVLDTISPLKDVDGFHPYNVGCLAQKRPLLRPCTPYGIVTLLHHYHIDLIGLNAVIVGASNIVGMPMALELLLAKSTVTVCHKETKNLTQHLQQADLLVTAIGKPRYIKGEWIKPGAIVIDVGINRLESGKICGDVDHESAAKIASWITPVPGGVGPMTVATLLENTLYAAEYLTQNKLEEFI